MLYFKHFINNYFTGVEANPGINQRALLKLFNETERMGHEWRFDIRVSVLEIYNESVRDLLVGESPEKLDIKLNTDGTLYVPGEFTLPYLTPGS